MNARQLLVCLLCLWVCGSSGFQSGISQQARADSHGPAALWQSLGRLRTTASVLYIIAHPDDEDAGTLTYLARGQGARTMLLSLTRGEGGANLISPYFFDALGILRSLELRRATEAYGTELFFTRAADYGYSKSLQEALKKWDGAEEILRDVVRVVRRERPDVIISRYRGDPRDGHGHHTLAGLLAQRAFEAAADPQRFPEQIREGLWPWQVKKLYSGNIRPGRRAEDKNLWTLVVDSGEYDPLVGGSYHQVARFGYGFHRSQGIMSHEGAAGPRKAYYRLLRTRLPQYSPAREESFFDGMDTTLEGIASLAASHAPSWLGVELKAVGAAVEESFCKLDLRNPEAIASPLVAGLGTLRRLIEKVRHLEVPPHHREHILSLLLRKEAQFEEALTQALGLVLEASADQRSLSPSSPFSSSSTFVHATPGEEFAVHLRLVSRCRLPLTEATLEVETPAGWVVEAKSKPQAGPLTYNETFAAEFKVQVPPNAEPTRPYWQRDSIQDTLYSIEAPAHQTLPFPPAPVRAKVQLKVLGEPIARKEVVRLTLRDLNFGTRHPPVTIAPALSVRFTSQHGILPLGKQRYPLSVEVRSNVKGAAAGTLRLDLPEGWRSQPESRHFAFAKEGEKSLFSFVVIPAASPGESEFALRAVADCNGRSCSEGFETVTARDVGRFNLYTPSRHRVRTVNVKIADGLEVGYIMGSGDDVPGALEFLGVHPRLLETNDLAGGDLSTYDVIIVGVRAYAVRSDIQAYNSRLLQYVKDGGTLLVQYQTPEFDENFGPYPYSMTQSPEEISEEDAAVVILEPQNPIFTIPNRITVNDFAGWVEQRGSKFWKTWDPRYTPLLESHDTDQPPQRGGMLYARYGKGVYLYSAYAWYRQLPHAVPGAFRIYANMLSLGKTRQ